LQGGVRQIFEEHAFFALVHIQTHAADLAGFERDQQGFGIDQAATAGVDDDRAALHAKERLGVNHVMRFRRQRRVQRDDVAALHQFFEADVFAAEFGHMGVVRRTVISEQLHAKAFGDAQGGDADLARAHDAKCAAVQVETNEAVKREVAVAHAHISAVGAAHQC